MQTTLSSPEIIPANLTAERLGNLIVASFRFSQGSTDVGDNILLLALNCHDPEEIAVNRDAALEHAYTKALDIVQKRGHVVKYTNRSVAAAINDIGEVVYSFIPPADELSQMNLLQNVAAGVIQRDGDYATRVMTKRSFGSPNKIYFSYFARHVILGQKAGYAEYTNIFDEMKDLKVKDLPAILKRDLSVTEALQMALTEHKSALSRQIVDNPEDEVKLAKAIETINDWAEAQEINL